jgi:hypothetical protein
LTGGNLKKRVTTITVEKERIVEIRWRGRKKELRCEQCGTEVCLLAADEAAAVACAGPCLACRCGSRIIELEGGRE